MNREMQARLVAILRDAMNAQGITQNDLARKIGTSSGMISQAFSGKAQMREERWRMCCEICGVDFDRFVETHQSSPVQTEPAHVEKEVHPMPDVKKNTVSVEMTVSQCHALKNFIESEIFKVIRSDSETPCSFIWLSNVMGAHSALGKAVSEYATDKA